MILIQFILQAYLYLFLFEVDCKDHFCHAPLVTLAPFLISVVTAQSFKKLGFLTGLEINIMVSLFLCVTASGQGAGKERFLDSRHIWLNSVSILATLHDQ